MSAPSLISASGVCWRAVAVSVVGARHLHAGTDGQDAVHLALDEQAAVVAVADGHGDARYPRSGTGAQIAVEVATELLAELARDLARDVDPAPVAAIEGRLRGHLARRLTWEWNRRVKQDAGHNHPDGAWHEDLELYGSTLLACVVMPERALVLRIGDGDILWAGADGQVRSMFSLPEELWGTQTWSLCQRSSANRVELRMLDLRFDRPRLVLLGTDGLRDSLDEGALEQVVRWLDGRVEDEPWDTLLEGLPDWLSELSRRGNGDDVSIGVVRWEPAPSPRSQQGGSSWRC